MYEEVFAQYLQFEKRYSKHTVTSYLHDVTDLFLFLASQFNITDPAIVRHAHVRAYVIHQVNLKLSPATLRQKLSAFKTYFKFCLVQGFVSVNPALRIITPKLPERLPKFVEQKNMDNLLDTLVDIFPPTWEGLRDRLIIELFYGTGIRRSELIGLSWPSIDYSKKLIKILGKGNKERFVPLTPTLESMLINYYSETKSRFPSLDLYWIVLTNIGEKSYDNFIYRTVKKYLSLCSTQTKISPHVLRHSFATHLSNNGAKLNDVKELLGHASLASTQVYTHNSIEQLKEVYKLAHPKA